ncbi:MAG TPA: Holliday junction DNA helicase RuvB C-terminal domain-containing protein, partial [Parcubacteria group bacterium]|nr:Holliday junction DNA helicase RuvB C-terminal domain-containing protein [Parcubacteria group bacterium]
QLGLIERTPRGRMLTVNGYNHIGLTPPKNLQNKLL